MSTKVSWPDLTFGPVNLYSLPPAWFFYMSREEKSALLHDAKYISNEKQTQPAEKSIH